VDLPFGSGYDFTDFFVSGIPYAQCIAPVHFVLDRHIAFEQFA
jgi:hypothetical protein